jgi:hypothetical protein
VTQRASLVRHPVSIAGALITTTAAVVFFALLIASMFGLFENPYAGLVVFVALPALFVLGLGSSDARSPAIPTALTIGRSSTSESLECAGWRCFSRR